MSQLSISAQLELRQCQDELLAISNKEKITPAEKRKFDALLARVSLLKSGAISDEVRAKQADAAAKEFGITIERLSEEQRARNERREEFRRFLKIGETRTYSGMNTTTGANGGFLVPADFQDELFKGIAQYDPLMDENNVRLLRTDNARAITLPGIALDTISSSIVTQNTQIAPVANPTVSKNVLAGYTYKTNPIAGTFELEQDSFEGLSSILTQAFSVGLARGIGADLVNGNGTTAPQGLLTAAANSGVTTGAAGVISATDINDIYFSVNRAYRNSPKCAWVMSDTVYQMIRAAKDSNNRPLLNMHGDDEVLMGKRVLVSPSVPSVAGSQGIIFGDLSQYVVRVVKNSTEITRSIETPGYAEKGIALFTAWTRVDANLIAPGSVTPVVYATLHS
jgi:HK97 family phage major capsid protein